MKKIFTLLLALMLVIGTAMPVFAEGESMDDEGDDITIYKVTMDAGEHGHFNGTYDEEGNWQDGECKQRVEFVQDDQTFFIHWPDEIDEGWRFEGWYCDPDFNESAEDVYGYDYILIGEDTTFYAKYVPIYTLTWDAGDYGYWDENGNKVRTRQLQFDEGETIYSLHIDGTEEGYIFDGWYFDNAFTDRLEDHYGDYGYPVTEDKTLYAKFVESSTITWVFGDGGYDTEWWWDAETGEGGQVKIKERKEEVPTGSLIHGYWPDTEDGYMFDKWYMDPELSDPMESHYDDTEYGYIVKEDVTFYAGYKIARDVTFHAGSNGYFVEYEYDEQTGTHKEVKKDIVIRSFADGAAITNYYYFIEPNSGYYFDQWYLDEKLQDPISDHFESVRVDGYITTGYVIKKNTHLYAGYVERKTVTLVAGENGYFDGYYDENGDWVEEKVNVRKESVGKGKAYWPMPPRYEDGYGFDGYYLDPEFTDPISDHYEEYMDKNGNYNSDAFIVREDVTLYARILPPYTITYNAGEHGYYIEYNDDGSEKGHVQERKETYNGAEVTWWIYPVAEGKYVADGWYLDKELTKKREDYYQPNENGWYYIGEDATFYLKWADAYTITLNAGDQGYYMKWDGQDYSEVKERDYNGKYGGMAYLGEPSHKDGYAFDGWYCDKELTKPIAEVYEKTTDADGEEAWIIDEDTTLYAKWAKGYTVTLNAGEYGNNPGYESITKKLGEPCVIKDPYPWDGYRFDGWYLDEGFTKPIADAYKKVGEGKKESTWIIDESVELYAKYVPDDVRYGEIVFMLNGGTMDGETYRVWWQEEIGTVIKMPLPTKEGYEFDYWKGSEYNAGDSYTVKGYKVFTAQWKEASAEPETKPSEPETKPAEDKSTTPAITDTNKSTNPPTGDDSNIALWILVMGMAAASFAATKNMRTNRK